MYSYMLELKNIIINANIFLRVAGVGASNDVKGKVKTRKILFNLGLMLNAKRNEDIDSFLMIFN